MSPELGTLGQLLGGDLPLTVIRRLFPDRERFVGAVVAMLGAGEVRLLDADRRVIPRWRWRDVLLAEPDIARLEITELGIRRIG